jgi:hypothetical protein
VADRTTNDSAAQADVATTQGSVYPTAESGHQDANTEEADSAAPKANPQPKDDTKGIVVLYGEEPGASSKR